MSKSNMLSCMFFTTKSNAGYYEDRPSFLEDVWPLLESHFHAIDNIYAFAHSKGGFIGSPIDRSYEIYEGFYDLGKGDAVSSDLHPQIMHLSYYGGDRNIFYKIRDRSFILELLSIWPYQSGIHQGINVLGLSPNDNDKLLKVASTVCKDGVVLMTLIHDADSIYVIGQFDTLKDILSMINIEKT